jgi:hypothetical protein
MFMRLGLPSFFIPVGCRSASIRNAKSMSVSFKCHRCGVVHQGLPFGFSAPAPYHYYEIPEQERRKRAVLGSDQCIIDGKHYFVLGRLDVRILDTQDMFSWGVWVSLSERNFKRMSELWHTKGREDEPPYFGWLNTQLPGYPETLNLKTQVHTQRLGERPLIELEPTDHPLALEQRHGISRARARRIAESLLHAKDEK